MKNYSWKPDFLPMVREVDAHPHIKEELADLFDVADGGSTEYEVLNWINASILTLKPQYVLETGAHNGIGTIALASACKANGFGKVHSLEIHEDSCRKVRDLLEKTDLSDWADVHCCNSLDFLEATNLIFDVAFFDSEALLRVKECEICFNRNMLKRLAVFHDTSPYRSVSWPEIISPDEQKRYREGVFSLAKDKRSTGLYDSHYSRGFMAIFLRQEILESIKPSGIKAL